jgi:hypothetical protein
MRPFLYDPSIFISSSCPGNKTWKPHEERLVANNIPVLLPTRTRARQRGTIQSYHIHLLVEMIILVKGLIRWLWLDGLGLQRRTRCQLLLVYTKSNSIPTDSLELVWYPLPQPSFLMLLSKRIMPLHCTIHLHARRWVKRGWLRIHQWTSKR